MAVPGVRPTPSPEPLTTVRLWDESARPASPRPPEGAARARSVINQMTLRNNRWTLGAYCASYCRIVTGHHSLEDQAVFPHLRAREPGLGPVIDRLASEHEVIHEVLEDLDAELVAMLASPGDFTRLQQAADVLTDVLLSHLAYEEAQLVEPLARHGFYTGQV